MAHVSSKPQMTQRAARTLPINLVSSDSHVWLRPLYARLRSDHRFGAALPLLTNSRLSPRLLKRTRRQRPQLLREWSPAAQLGLLGWLEDAVRAHPNPISEVELWRVRKGDRGASELRSGLLAGRGIDVRLMEGRRLSAHAARAGCARH